MSAIQRTTAAATCTVLDLLAEGKLPASGMVCQEEISLDAFLAKRFGRTTSRSPDARPNRLKTPSPHSVLRELKRNGSGHVT